MAHVRKPEGDAWDKQRVASAPGDAVASAAASDLPTPLDLVRRALNSVEDAKAHYPDYRLTQLVSERLELDDEDAWALLDIIGIAVEAVVRPAPQNPFLFEEILRDVIARHGLAHLFANDGRGPHHHAIRPTGYDFVEDQVIPTGMEQWRADYRAMSDHRQNAGRLDHLVLSRRKG